jgi:nucleoside-diphosphate-sugar epimerase
VTILDVADAITDAFGPGAPRPVITGRYRLGDVRHVVASPDLARSWLGVQAGVALRDGLADLATEGDRVPDDPAPHDPASHDPAPHDPAPHDPASPGR